MNLRNLSDSPLFLFISCDLSSSMISFFFNSSTFARLKFPNSPNVMIIYFIKCKFSLEKIDASLCAAAENNFLKGNENNCQCLKVVLSFAKGLLLGLTFILFWYISIIFWHISTCFFRAVFSSRILLIFFKSEA